MRQIIAWFVCILTVGLVAGLSLLFASAHNPRAPALTPPAAAVPVVDPGVAVGVQRENQQAPQAPAAPTPAVREHGREVYERENCSTCHAIAGIGNPRIPLDGIGKRLNAEQLKAWVTGTGVAVDGLPPSTVRRKQRYLALSQADLEALVAYLSHLDR